MNPIFEELLKEIRPVNFRELNGINANEKVKVKHLIVTVVDQLLNLAKHNNLGLCKRNQFVYLFNGEYWKPIETHEFKTFLGIAANAMGVNMVDSKFYHFRDELYKQFVSDAHTPQIDRPKDTVLINLKNGTFEVTPKRRRLREFRAEDFLTYKLNFEYDETATAPAFIQYLETVLPDKELQQLLSEFIGYVFAKHLKLEKCLLLYGDGANGKSVFFDIINSLLGRENVSNFSLGNLNEEHNRALITNKLLNYGSEIKADIEKDYFKALVSGESIQARLKYKDSIIIDDYARLCFNCNELPSNVEHTNGYFRRFLIIPFNVIIPEEKQDPLLATKIVANELSGIFNWVLQGLNLLLLNGKFSESIIVKEMIKSFKEESDSVYQFINENRFISSNETSYLFSEVMNWYMAFCKDNNLRAIGRSKFSKRLKKHGFEIGRKNQGGNTHIFLDVKK